jgi:hypothetical protein
MTADNIKQTVRCIFLLDSIAANMAHLLFHKCRVIAAIEVETQQPAARLRENGPLPASCGSLPVKGSIPAGTSL